MLMRPHRRALTAALFCLLLIALAFAFLDHRLHDWLLSPASASAHDWLGKFARVVIPMLCVLHLGLGTVNARQQRTPIQAAMTRFLFVKASFWGVFWLNFHIRQTWLWLILDVITLIATFVTATDLGVRLLRSYVFVRRIEPLPHPYRLDPS